MPGCFTEKPSRADPEEMDQLEASGFRTFAGCAGDDYPLIALEVLIPAPREAAGCNFLPERDVGV